MPHFELISERSIVETGAAVRHHLREVTRIAPDTRPALWLGVRAAAAVGLPLVFAPALGSVVTTWATLAGFNVAIVDRGGAYAMRARTLAIAAFAGLVANLLGTLVAGNIVAMLVVVPLGCGVLALSHAWGPKAIPVGNTVSIQLILAASLPFAASSLPLRLSGFALGAAWAIFLSLVVWPVRVYRPGRKAVARGLHRLARHAAALAALESTHDEHLRQHRALREALEDARGLLAATRRGRRTDIGSGEWMRSVVAALDEAFGMVTLLEEVHATMPPRAHERLAPILAHDFAELARGLDEVADHLSHPSETPTRPLDWREPPPGDDLEPIECAALAQARVLLSRLASRFAILARLVDAPPEDEDIEVAPVPLERRSSLEVLRVSLDRHSAVLRHAIRVAVIVFATIALTDVLPINNPYWVTITALVLLQPYRSLTVRRSLQRILGTVFGGALAAVVASHVQDHLAWMLIVVALAGTSGAVLQLNYMLYLMFITPTWVLLAGLYVRDPEIVQVRIIDTALGSLVALAGAFALWPARDPFPAQIASALEAAAAHLREAMFAVAHGTPSPSPVVTSARRRADLAINHAELALDHIAADRSSSAPRMALLLFIRRLVAATGAFATARTITPGPPHASALLNASSDLTSELYELADAVRRGERPLPHRPHRHAAAISDPVLSARLARIESHVESLREAAARIAAPAQNGS